MEKQTEMVLGTQPKAGIKEPGETAPRPAPPDGESGRGAAEERASQAQPRGGPLAAPSPAATSPPR